MSLLDAFAGFVADTRSDQIPDAQIGEAKLCLLDTIGAIYVGSGTEIGRTAEQVAPSPADGSGAVILTTGVQTDALTAAQANASLAHCAEIDCIHPRAIVCVGSMVVPAALACAARKNCTGRELLEAIALGCEVAIRLGAAVRGEQLLAGGWWPSSVFGPLGAAAAAARLSGSPRALAKQALSICSTIAGGLINGGAEGATARHFLSGWSARAGVASVQAAMSGFTGPDDGLQEAKGLYTSRGVEVDAAPILEGLGEVYHLSEILYKGHASCMQAQAGVHGLLALTQDITPEQVAAVRVGLPKKAFVVVETQGVPANHTAAGAHGPYLMAAALLHRKILPAQFEDECLRDERMHALMRRVTVLEDPALEQYRDGWPARVEVELIDGSLRQTELAGWMGEGAEERRVFVAKKFATTMAITTGASRAGEILDCVMGLDEDKTPSMLLAATGTQEGG